MHIISLYLGAKLEVTWKEGNSLTLLIESECLISILSQ